MLSGVARARHMSPTQVVFVIMAYVGQKYASYTVPDSQTDQAP